MTDAPSAVDQLASAVHRTILGVLLAFLAVYGLDLVGRGSRSNPLAAAVGLVVAVLAVGWIASLFREGLAEGAAAGQNGDE